MPKCIYRETMLNANDPPDGDTATLEHIIPWAIGGSNGFTVGDASKEANNDLGSAVDANFSNTLFIAIMRHKLQLKSQGNNIPPIIWKGEAADGTKATFTIEADGTASVAYAFGVNKPEPGQTGLTTIRGEREKATMLIEGIIRGAKKRGETIYSTKGKLLETLDDFLEVSEVKSFDEVKLKVEYFNKEAWTRGILKIVLAAGHKILGKDWTFGPDAAALRQTIMNPKSGWPESPRGFIAGELNRTIRISVCKTGSDFQTYKHNVCVLPVNEGGRGVMVVSLFGGNSVPEAVVDLGQLPEATLKAINEDVLTYVLGYKVDPETRATTPITYGMTLDSIKRNMGATKEMLQLYQTKIG